AFRFYVFPILLMTLIFTFFILPQTSNTISTVENTGYMDLFKKIVGYRSALACLLGSILTTIASGGIIWYFISFYKETFGISTAIVGLIWSVNTFVNVVGSLLCGKIIPRFGNKFVTYVSSIFIGLSIVFLIHVQNYLLAIVIGLFFPFFSALWGASSNALALKQVPEYKGAMMSLNMGATQLGRSLGSFIGGVALNIGGYSLMGITFCIVSLLAFLIVYFISLEN
ncbi:MFS transporter, partial [Candidatus Bathyarchaeota archaeon]|nr:MFS transporter [Candidatus Bathyarchaeota archaeon]